MEAAQVRVARPTPDAESPQAMGPRPGRPGLQAKLVVGASDDRAEIEADRVAEAVLRRLRGGGAAVQWVEADDDVWAPRATRIRRASSGAASMIGPEGGDVDRGTEDAIRRARSGGRPLDADVRRSMERGFGADFSPVRIHTDRAAHALNERIQASAATVGSDIFFRQASYNPSSTRGRHLLAHELAHVLQQRAASPLGGAAAQRRAEVVPGLPAGAGSRIQPRVDHLGVDVIERPHRADLSCLAASPRATGRTVIRRMRWRGTGGVSVKNVDEVYESLKSGRRLLKDWDEGAVKAALAEIEKEQGGVADPDLPDWSGLQNLLKKKMGAQTTDEKAASLASGKAQSRRVFAERLETGEPLTIKQLKEFLDAGPAPNDPTQEAPWKTATRLAEKTYLAEQKEVKQPAFLEARKKELSQKKREATAALKGKGKLAADDPRFSLEKNMTAEEAEEFETYKADVRASTKKTWKDTDVVPPDILKKLAAKEARAQRERQALQKRGIPSELFDDSTTSSDATYASTLTTSQLEQLEQSLKLLHAATAQAVFTALASEAPTRPLRYLRDMIAAILVEITPYATNLKASGKEAILALVLKKHRDIGDAKGAIGELNAVLLAAKEGTDVNTGGPNKLLPGAVAIGGVLDQDVDVRYVKGGDTRVHMEAKWDAATLINTYQGEAPQKGKKKDKSFQEQRYEALRDKPVKSGGRSAKRELRAIVANPHDWLRLFVPGSGGMSVSKWLADGDWTLIIKDKPVPPPTIRELLQVVPDYHTKVGIKGSAPEWADATSPSFPDPLDFLKHAKANLVGTTTGDVDSTPKPSATSSVPVVPVALSPSPLNDNLLVFLSSLDAGWDQPGSERASSDSSMIVGVGSGVMLGAATKATSAHPLSGEIELPTGSQFLTNNGKGALCFVYALVMGLTNRPQSEVQTVVLEIATTAGALGGWIALDSKTAQQVIGEVERKFQVAIQVVEVQKSDQGPRISGRSHDVNASARRPIIIRNTGAHFDAIV